MPEGHTPSQPNPEQEQLNDLEKLTREIRLADNPVTAAEILQQALNREGLRWANAVRELVPHELNNQLALVVGYADIVTERPDATPDMRGLLEEMANGAQSAARFVNKFQRPFRQLESEITGGREVLDLDKSLQAPTPPEGPTSGTTEPS